MKEWPERSFGPGKIIVVVNMKVPPDPLIRICRNILAQELLGFDKSHRNIESTMVLTFIVLMIALANYLEARILFFLCDTC